jgi:hypothetical protein
MSSALQHGVTSWHDIQHDAHTRARLYAKRLTGKAAPDAFASVHLGITNPALVILGGPGHHSLTNSGSSGRRLLVFRVGHLLLSGQALRLCTIDTDNQHHQHTPCIAFVNNWLRLRLLVPCVLLVRHHTFGPTVRWRWPFSSSAQSSQVRHQ